MIEKKIDALIAALTANTAALTASGTHPVSAPTAAVPNVPDHPGQPLPPPTAAAAPTTPAPAPPAPPPVTAAQAAPPAPSTPQAPAAGAPTKDTVAAEMGLLIQKMGDSGAAMTAMIGTTFCKIGTQEGAKKIGDIDPVYYPALLVEARKTAEAFLAAQQS